MSALVLVLPSLIRAATTMSDISMGSMDGTLVRSASPMRARYACDSQGASNGSGVFGWEVCDCRPFQNAVPENAAEKQSMAAESGETKMPFTSFEP